MDTRPRFITFLACAVLLVTLAPQTSDLFQIRKREMSGVSGFEYPVLAKVLYVTERAVAPAPMGIDLLNAAVGVVAAVGVAALLRKEREAQSLWMTAPSLMLVAVNVDAITALMILLVIRSWGRARYREAGVWAGLGTAFKIAPGLLLPPLLMATTRRGGMRMILTAVIIWLVVNVPYATLHPAAWRYPYEYASQRQDVRGTIWAVVGLNGPAVNVAFPATFAILGLAVALAAHRRYLRAETGCALTLLVYLATNKVWQPHYLLWALPALAIAEAPLWPLRVLELTNLANFFVLWYHWDLTSRPLLLFWLGVVGTARLAALAWLSYALIRRDLTSNRLPGTIDAPQGPQQAVLNIGDVSGVEQTG
jgi:uncharacterized membrane protein